MSLREIRRHNRYEIITMLKAIERMNIIENGQQISSLTTEQRVKLIKEHPEYSELDNYYKGELYLLDVARKRRGGIDYAESDGDELRNV